jgi:AcrR family transcriptional regulator
MAKIHPGKDSTRKDVITKNAAVLFKAKGFKAASMRELADAIGIEAPSLYNHIGSKSELLQEICFRVADRFTANLKIIDNSRETITGKIESVIRFHIRMMLENFDEVFVANHEWKHLSEPLLKDFLNQRRNYEKKLVVLIETGIAKKELKKSNAYIIVLTILSAVRGLEFWQRHKKKIDPKILEDTMVGQLLNGIIK